MAVQNKPNTNVVWAGGPFGRLTPPTAEHQLNGYGPEIPPYDEFNGVINQLSAFNQHVNQFGVPVWDYLTSYPIYGYVASPIDGNLYRAVAASQNVPPVTVVGGAVNPAWVRVSFTSQEMRPAGESAFFAMATAPAGWLKENGAAYSRTAYAALFAAIGTTYGAGDGSTTFNVPDSRARFKRPLDEGKGLDPGRVIGSLADSQNLSHDHTASSGAAGAHTHTATTGAAGAHTPTATTASGGDHNHTINQGSITPDGADESDPAGNEPHNLLNPGSGGITKTNLVTTDGAHTHGVTVAPVPDHTHTATVNAVGDHAHTVTVNASGGAEARPISIAYLSCIKY